MKNKKKTGGYGDWRFPTSAEAKGIFDKDQANKDYMGQKTGLYTAFLSGFGFLCWTSEVRNKIQAVRFGYRKGAIMYDDVYRVSRGATRMVRTVENPRNVQGHAWGTHRTLQSKTDDSIFTLGDSAEVIMPDGKRLTPRAQIAHQQALFLSNNLIRAINKETLQEFEFKDMGSFVSLGAKNSVGTVLSFTNFNMQGIVAKWSYIMLYRRHQYELLGGYKTWILIIKDLMTRVLGPKLKLHWFEISPVTWWLQGLVLNRFLLR